MTPRQDLAGRLFVWGVMMGLFSWAPPFLSSHRALRDANARLDTNAVERRQTEERYKLIVDSISDYAIFMLDTAGNVASWNLGAEKIKGYREAEILGRPYALFFTKEDQASGKPQHGLEVAVAGGRFECEDWRVRKDGSLFWAGVVLTAMRGKHGELVGFSKVQRDLSEHKRAEDALHKANDLLVSDALKRAENLTELTRRLEAEIEEHRASDKSLLETKELLEATFDAAPFPIIVTKPGGDVLMWNKAGEATYGITLAELTANGYGMLVPAGQRGEAERIRIAAEAGNVSTASQIHLRDGRTLDVRLSIAPVFAVDGTMRAIVTVMEDVTQKNQIEAQFRQAQKMEAIGTLTGGMAHDFNNLLGVIIGNLDILRDMRPNDAELTELSGEALEAALRGADLTRRLLAFARRQPLQSRRIDLNVLINGTVKLIGRLLGDHIEIVLSLARNVCPVLADPGQLESALTNLATNARDAMPKGGKLIISTSGRTLDADYVLANPGVAQGDYAMITVTDTGTGMSPEIRNRIFEPFFSTKEERGTGLGLSMVFGFMKQSGGHISVYSEPGVGTTFRLFLPCTREPEEKGTEPQPDGSFAGRGETVLVVDDNEAVRRIVSRQLNSLGYHVLEAGDGVEAMEILKTSPIDLLFTDVVMPGGIDGFALAGIAQKQWPCVRIILTSGFPQTRFAEDFGPHGWRLLSKPYRKEELARMIRDMLDGRGEQTPVA